VIIILQPHEALYIRALGRMVRVHGICATVTIANQYLAFMPHISVIAEFGGLVFLADKNDEGIKIPPAMAE